MIDILTAAVSKNDPAIWNKWRSEIDSLSEINIENFSFEKLGVTQVDSFIFTYVTFKNCDFSRTVFTSCHFVECNFIYQKTHSIPQFSDSDFRECLFNYATFKNAILSDVSFPNCNLNNTRYIESTLIRVNWHSSSLVQSVFKNCEISMCQIYAANIWDIDTDSSNQKDLLVSSKYGGMLYVDDMEMANVVHLVAANKRFFKNSDKANFVLLLGRFETEQNPPIFQLRDKLRELKYSPIIFDFEKAKSLTLTEMIIFLALFSKFIVVDISDPRSVPSELQAILSSLMIPVRPIRNRVKSTWSTFSSINKFDWVLPVLVFDDFEDVLKKVKSAIIDPLSLKHREIIEIKNRDKHEQDINAYPE